MSGPGDATEPAASLTAPDPSALKPTQGAERVEVIDALRGLALFGILAANIRGHAGPAVVYFRPELMWPGLADRIAQAFIDTFVQGKFITLFACLFGLGFAMQLERLAARVPRFGRYYVRRSLLLMAIGLIHGLLIWFGDILLLYGFVGLLLLLFRKKPDRGLALWGAGLYVVPTLLIGAVVLASSFGGVDMELPEPPTPQELQELVTLQAEGSWIEIQSQRTQDALQFSWGPIPIVGMQVLGLFLLGMLAWRRQLFRPQGAALLRYRRAVTWCLAVGIVGNATATLLRWVFDIPVFPPAPGTVLIQAIAVVAVPALSAGYAGSVVLLFHDPGWRARLAPFAAVGRTALTNYLLQSVLGTLLFYSYGLGLTGTAGPALLLVPTVVIYTLQVYASRAWLQRFRFGPVEWLWRALAYGTRPPLLREST